MIGDYLYLHIIELISVTILIGLYILLIIPFVYIINSLHINFIIGFTLIMLGTTLVLSSIRVWNKYRGVGSISEDSYIYDYIDEIDADLNKNHLDVLVVKSNVPNAYAIDALPMRPKIVLTKKLVNTLSEDELKAVIAHEISHIHSYDVFYMTFLSTVVSFLREIHNVTRKGIYSNDIFWFIIYIVPFIITRILLLISNIIFYYCSRIREYKADIYASQNISSSAMKSSLKSVAIEMNKTTKEQRERFRDYEPLCIITINDIEEKYFKTHPDLEDRFENIDKLDD